MHASSVTLTTGGSGGGVGGGVVGARVVVLLTFIGTVLVAGNMVDVVVIDIVLVVRAVVGGGGTGRLTATAPALFVALLLTNVHAVMLTAAPSATAIAPPLFKAELFVNVQFVMANVVKAPKTAIAPPIDVLLPSCAELPVNTQLTKLTFTVAAAMKAPPSVMLFATSRRLFVKPQFVNSIDEFWAYNGIVELTKSNPVN
jgi:hypothetical protein